MTRKEREKAIDALKISAPIKAMTQEEFNDYIQTLNEVMDWLEQEPCEDAISREAVDELSKELVHTTRDKADFLCNFWEGLQKLPPVTPQPKTGRWIEHFDESGKWYECDQCHTDWGGSVNYCPNCGARMIDERESEG